MTEHVPDDVTLIAESGIGSPADVRRMRAAGADALLVGSAIMDGDVEANTRALTRAEPDDGDDVAEPDDGDDVAETDDADAVTDETTDTTETPT